MKVTAFVGSARKKGTYNATVQFLNNLHSLGNIESEIVALSNYRLGTCKGCKVCFEKGEEFCPLKDDRDKLIEKINNSDGIIFASPNYSFNVSGFMKIFLDRLGFVFHRPQFFGKACTSIVTQGFYGGKKIIEYFNFVGMGLGFNVVNGSCLPGIEPLTENDHKTINNAIEKQSKKFYSTLIRKEFPSPNIFKLMIFRMSRTSINLLLDERSKDYRYFKKNGWLESDYYYQVQLNPFKKITGRLFDFIFTRIYRKSSVEKAVLIPADCEIREY